MARYLLDSVIVIDHFNGVDAAREFLAAHGQDCVISVITRAETLAGFPPESEPLALELLDQFAALPVTIEVADAAAKLRHHHGMKLPDAIQAPIAIQEGMSLVTRNTRDFKADGPVAVTIPYQLPR
ncbi:MAG: type II toxin-antitoxin system VapC family toxin [Gemmatimonadetes bacterium]|nr:type II toxin-antitoxin system VapC family toxin [Gemmatimonadota bacterium]MYG85079.1 type II toxin-antitoxin system VapC family toxin [Gemmatimonadota bacterium]MYJ91058.1 type II toxin-antitoxin system VapC family toxin [Gemmatimonadota bacterium]